MFVYVRYNVRTISKLIFTTIAMKYDPSNTYKTGSTSCNPIVGLE